MKPAPLFDDIDTWNTLNQTDELTGKNDGQERAAQSVKGKIGRRQRKNNQIAGEIDALNRLMQNLM